jgi:hypothetical protein
MFPRQGLEQKEWHQAHSGLRAKLCAGAARKRQPTLLCRVLFVRDIKKHSNIYGTVVKKHRCPKLSFPKFSFRFWQICVLCMRCAHRHKHKHTQFVFCTCSVHTDANTNTNTDDLCFVHALCPQTQTQTKTLTHLCRNDPTSFRPFDAFDATAQ